MQCKNLFCAPVSRGCSAKVSVTFCSWAKSGWCVHTTSVVIAVTYASVNQKSLNIEVFRQESRQIREIENCGYHSLPFLYFFFRDFCAVPVSRVHANHVRNGVESLPTFEQNLEILQSAMTTFACILLACSFRHTKKKKSP